MANGRDATIVLITSTALTLLVAPAMCLIWPPADSGNVPIESAADGPLGKIRCWTLAYVRFCRSGVFHCGG